MSFVNICSKNRHIDFLLQNYKIFIIYCNNWYFLKIAKSKKRQRIHHWLTQSDILS